MTKPFVKWSYQMTTGIVIWYDWNKIQWAACCARVLPVDVIDMFTQRVDYFPICRQVRAQGILSG